jgi:hypothetical protein
MFGFGKKNSNLQRRPPIQVGGNAGVTSCADINQHRKALIKSFVKELFGDDGILPYPVIAVALNLGAASNRENLKDFPSDSAIIDVAVATKKLGQSDGRLEMFEQNYIRALSTTNFGKFFLGIINLYTKAINNDVTKDDLLPLQRYLIASFNNYQLHLHEFAKFYNSIRPVPQGYYMVLSQHQQPANLDALKSQWKTINELFGIYQKR